LLSVRRRPSRMYCDSAWMQICTAKRIKFIHATFICRIYIHASEWTITKISSKRLDAFDTWYLRKILRIPYTRHTTNETVRYVTACTPVPEVVRSHRLRFFGHQARTESSGGSPRHHGCRALNTRWVEETGREQLGSEQSMKTSSPRTSEFTPLGWKPKIGTFGAKSSAWQRSDVRQFANKKKKKH